MQNLAWNGTKEGVEEKAREVLTQAGVPMESVEKIDGGNRKTFNGVDIVFKQPAHIATSKTRVRMLQKCLLKDCADVPAEMKNNVVWFNRAKTRQELRPARLIHRI
eukprot:8764305-Karenia_brevis.AAC.1